MVYSSQIAMLTNVDIVEKNRDTVEKQRQNIDINSIIEKKKTLTLRDVATKFLFLISNGLQ